MKIGSAIFERRAESGERRAASGEDASPEPCVSQVRARARRVGEEPAKSRQRVRHFRFVQQKRDCSKSNGDGKRLGVTVLYLVMFT